MRSITTMLAIGATALFFTACGGGGSSSSGGGGNTPAPPQTVNFVGNWKYVVATEGSICDGLIAQGDEIIEPYNGDNSLIGNIILSGTMFEVDAYGTCYLSSIDKIDTSKVGIPSNMTKSEAENFIRNELSGIGTIQSFELINYNKSIVSSKFVFTNGVVMYEDLTRQ